MTKTLEQQLEELDFMSNHDIRYLGQYLKTLKEYIQQHPDSYQEAQKVLQAFLHPKRPTTQEIRSDTSPTNYLLFDGWNLGE